MDGESHKSFVAYFRGHSVSCQTVKDAVAIIRADTVFREQEVCTPRELDRLAAVLTKYKLYRFAESLVRQASRLRAAEYLLLLTGFERP
jgi:hypothetical protein